MYELAICTKRGEVLKRFDLGRLSEPGKAIRLGRSEDCDIRIRSPWVSRHHCEIRCTAPNRWLFKDLGSTHGSFVDDVPVHEISVDEGLTVAIGPAVLKFESFALRIAEELSRELGDSDTHDLTGHMDDHLGDAPGHHETLPH